MKKSHKSPVTALSEYDDQIVIDESILDTINSRLVKANAFAGEILRRTECVVDRLYREPRDEDCEADTYYQGMIGELNYRLDTLMDTLNALDRETRVIERL